MEGYIYVLLVCLSVVILCCKFCIYGWCKGQSNEAVQQQRNTIHAVYRTQGNNVYVHSEQANIIPPSIYGNQEQPTEQNQPFMANQYKPPTCSEIGEHTKGMNNEQAPPTYYDAFTYPYSANASGLTSDVTAPYPYPAAAGRPTSPGTTLYPYPANASGPISPGTTPYPYHDSGPTSPGTTSYPYPASASGPTNPGRPTTPYSANDGGLASICNTQV